MRCGAAFLAVALLAAALVSASLAVLPAERAGAQTAQTLVSNAGQASTGTGNFQQHDHAQAFTTGSNAGGYSLRSIGVQFRSIVSSFDASWLTASIHSDSGGSPGSSLGTLTKPASFPVSSSRQTLRFTTAGIDLAANTTYFVVFDMSTSSSLSRLQSTNSDDEDSGGLPGWSIGDAGLWRFFSDTGSWSRASNRALKVSFGGVSKPRPPWVSVSGGGAVTEGGDAVFTVTVDPPPVEQDQPDQPDQVPLIACADRPTLLISSPTASRSDATVDFEVSLSCIPARPPVILLTPLRDGNIGNNIFVSLSAATTSTTVTVTTGTEQQLGLVLVWSTGQASRWARTRRVGPRRSCSIPLSTWGCGSGSP